MKNSLFKNYSPIELKVKFCSTLRRDLLAGRESITFPTSISVDRGVIGFDGSTGKV
jgi:hypothetical protein